MKRFTFFLLPIAVLSCKPKSKPLQPYDINIKMITLDVTGSRMVPEIKTDTLMATDDTIAFDRALIRYYATLKSERMTGNRVSKSESFNVTDSLGNDLSVKLPKSVVDSMQTGMRKLAGF